ncbi:MAG: hypothetical protein R2695_18265 [Acidimicrobiales bacterium]
MRPPRREAPARRDRGPGRCGRCCGATLYTTLEPCNHQGRTGPCTEALIVAGVGRVVVAIEDPDPKVAGAGVARLREAVEVTVGIGAAEATAQLRPYLHHRRTGRPWVVLKSAATLDGRVAPRRFVAVDHRRRGPGRRASVAGRVGRDRRGCGNGAGRRSVADGARLAAARLDHRPDRDHRSPPDRARSCAGRRPDRTCLEHVGELDELLDRLGPTGSCS